MWKWRSGMGVVWGSVDWITAGDEVRIAILERQSV